MRHRNPFDLPPAALATRLKTFAAIMRADEQGYPPPPFVVDCDARWDAAKLGLALARVPVYPIAGDLTGGRRRWPARYTRRVF